MGKTKTLFAILGFGITAGVLVAVVFFIFRAPPKSVAYRNVEIVIPTPTATSLQNPSPTHTLPVETPTSKVVITPSYKVTEVVIQILPTELFMNTARMDPEIRRQKILDSLTMIDQYPAYTMNYYGDYSLDTALANGIKDFEDITQHFESIYHINLLHNLETQGEGESCSGFTAVSENGEYLFGHNEDWISNDKYLVFFTAPDKGYASVNITDISYLGEDKDALLITPFMPLAGMNSEGLVVTTYSVPQCFPPQDAKKTSLFWLVAVRLLLDRAANIDEALQLLDEFNILFDEDMGLQFLIGDAQGYSVIVEWLDGKTIPIEKTGDWQAVTNFIQKDAAEVDIKRDQRYQIASTFLEQYNHKISAEVGMELLRKTSQFWGSQGGTQFSVIFNQSRRDLHIVFGRNYEKVYYFPLK